MRDGMHYVANVPDKNRGTSSTRAKTQTSRLVDGDGGADCHRGSVAYPG